MIPFCGMDFRMGNYFVCKGELDRFAEENLQD